MADTSISNPQIEKWIKVSYSHLPQSDIDKARETDADLSVSVVAVDDFGFRIRLQHERVFNEASIKGDDFSEAFLNIILVAHDMGCYGVHFDEDGYTYEEWPQYEGNELYTED